MAEEQKWVWVDGRKLPPGANLIKLTSGRQIHRREEDVITSDFDVKIYYNLVRRILVLDMGVNEYTEWIHLLGYGSLFESALKKLLKERYKDNNIPASIEEYFKAYSYEDRNDKDRRFYNYGVHSQSIIAFDKQLKVLNDAYNTAKHSRETLCKPCVCLGYLLEFFEYVSDQEIPRDILEIAYEGTLFRPQHDDFLEAKRIYKQKFGLGKLVIQAVDVEKDVLTLSVELEEKERTSPVKVEQRMPILVILDANPVMSKSGVFFEIICWLILITERLGQYNVDLGWVTYDDRDCVFNEFRALRNQTWLLKNLKQAQPHPGHDGRGILTQALAVGLEGLSLYMNNNKIAVLNPLIVVFTDGDREMYDCMQENVQSKCNNLGFPDDMNITLYGCHLGEMLVEGAGGAPKLSEEGEQSLKQIFAQLDEVIRKKIEYLYIG